MTGSGDRLVTSLNDMIDVGRLYRDAPEGLRANMIFSADGAAAIDGRVKGLTCAADQYLLRRLRGYSDAVLVGGATARAESYGPVRLSADQRKQRAAAGLQEPRLAIVTLSGRLPESLRSPVGEPPVLLTSRTAAERRSLATMHTTYAILACTIHYRGLIQHQPYAIITMLKTKESSAMTNTILIEDYTGRFLPNAISDTWHTAEDVAAWIKAQGYSVAKTETTDRYARATTTNNLTIYRNGYVINAAARDDA